MVEHRAGGGLTCKTASGGFGSGPGMETLVAVGHSLGGRGGWLCPLKCVDVI